MATAIRRRDAPGSADPGSVAGAPGAISEQERLQKALDLAYAYLNPRDRTVSDVRQRLQRRGVSDEVTEAAIQILGEQGFLDDTRFAALFVADKRTLEQWGSERIRRGLLSHGIDRHLAETALAGDPTAESDDAEPESELDRALALLRRRFPDPPEDRRDRNRALGMLLRKGYEIRARARRPGCPRPRRLSEGRPLWTAQSWRAGSRATSAPGARRAPPRSSSCSRPSATYRAAPFAEPVIGLAAIAAFWEAEREGPDEPFTLRLGAGRGRGQCGRRPRRGRLPPALAAGLSRPVDHRARV